VPREKSWVLQLDVENATEAELNELQAAIANIIEIKSPQHLLI
jgi:hypothetical protein